MSSKIEIYTSESCFYCIAAKRLLNEKKLKFSEFDITNNKDQRNIMVERSNGRRTVPQIFISNIHIGGCDELYALENLGRLDEITSEIFNDRIK
ncbi:MAG: glutaredoxin 3 [Hyphomicrobiales bacterium]|nr:glutaredoxin 3 [Hyphomicrobiales bacterium]